MGAALAGAFLCLASAASGQNGAAPGYEIVSNGQALELRFRGVPLRSVRADDNQNALALDFNQPVDPAIFDHLSANLPGWIAMAYSSYDNGVIRAVRPVTFLTRPEVDGFSLRLEPRTAMAQAQPFQPAPYQAGPAPQAAPYPPPQQQPYPQQAPPPPPQGAPAPFAPFEAYAAARSYYGLRQTVRRGDTVWAQAYQASAMRSDSGVTAGTELRSFKNGDRILSSQADIRIGLGAVALLAGIRDADTKSKTVRTETGTFLANGHNNRMYGSLGLAFAAGGDSEVSLEALGTDYAVGGRLKGYSASPNGFVAASLTYHQPYFDTPQALQVRAVKDEVAIATAQRMGYGLWGSLKAAFSNYGIHGHNNAVQTASWDANLRWDAELMPALLAGIAYDGQGEYRLRYDTLTGTAPSPYVPLSIRNMETHAGTFSLSAGLWDQVWLGAFGGYVYDRYAKSGGGIYGGSLRVSPAPGFEIELGARHSNISLLQGVLGGETQAGISLNLGFGGPPNRNAFSLW